MEDLFIEYFKEFKELSKNDRRILSTTQLYKAFGNFIRLNYPENHQKITDYYKKNYSNYNKRINLLKTIGFNKAYNYCDCNGGTWNLWT